MTSSGNSSSSRAALAALALLCGCATSQPPRLPDAARRAQLLAFFPPANLSGAVAPMADLAADLEKALRARGVQLVSGAALEPFLAAHRVRYVAGVGPEIATRARDELGVSGIVISTLTSYQEDPPRLGFELRVVSATDEPQILWSEGAARAGDESPGLFELGIVREMKRLRQRLFEPLAESLASWQRGRAVPQSACAPAKRFGPRIWFRAPALDGQDRWTIAVLPFVNRTSRRSAGDVVPLQFVRQLRASGRFRVIEPGVVREELLRFRVVMEEGVSLDMARVVMELLDADLVLAGEVSAYGDAVSAAVAPSVQFTAMVLDRDQSELLWESTSDSRGDDGVFFFDAGKVSTADALTCRMARTVVDALVDGPAPPPPRRFEVPPPPGPFDVLP